jgi:eukaryotic-like serine/threonine-protein kinase
VAALADRYRLERELGQGGMATVYLADDLKHDRKVAVKVLRPELAAVIGAERFLSEIKTTANLQHPHILPLFDSGEADSFLFYVMPYVEGETVRDRISQEKQLPVADAVRIASEVASALDYAHRRGVIHRDIKPENILLHDGRAMVADFGIALAASKAGGTRMTETGMSLGTPHYMSPEQAMGEREITARSDVYALGCVLYEMLTGEPPFTGTTAQAIVARVVTETPRPMLPQRHTIPPHVEAAVFTALEKLPADRFATAAEFGAALTSVAYTRPMTGYAVAASPAAGRWRRIALAASTVAAASAALALWGWFRPRAPQPVARFGIAFPDSQVPQGLMVLSPDGARLVYQGPGDSSGGRLWVKERDRYEATVLPGTVNAASPIISPDGKWVAFLVQNRLMKMPVGGGAPTPLADSVFVTGAAWLDDGTLVYTSTSFALMRVSEAGGPATLLLKADSNQRYRVLPTPLPGGRGVLFTDCNNGCTSADLWLFDLRSGKARRLLPGVLRGWYLSTGHLVYVGHDGGMFAVAFDLKSLEIHGTPVPVLGGVALIAGVIPNVTVAANGTLVMQGGHLIGGEVGLFDMAWVDRAGATRPVDTSWTFRLSVGGGNVGWALSPDGTRLAIGLNTRSGDDIWIKQLPTGPLSRLTFDSTDEVRPRWSPDGRFVLFNERDTTLRQRRADGTGSIETVMTLKHTINEGLWSKDGKWLIARAGGRAGGPGGRDIFGIRPGVDSAPVPLAANPRYDEAAPALSPDGKWLAYESDETGRMEVYIRPFPNTEGGKWQVSVNGGQAPLWAHGGRELFFVDGTRNMVAVPVSAGTSPQLGDRKVLFHLTDDLYLGDPENYTPFDITPDDRHFIMARQVRAATTGRPTFLLVDNWFEELKSKDGNK